MVQFGVGKGKEKTVCEKKANAPRSESMRDDRAAPYRAALACVLEGPSGGMGPLSGGGKVDKQGCLQLERGKEKERECVCVYVGRDSEGCIILDDY